MNARIELMMIGKRGLTIRLQNKSASSSYKIFKIVPYSSGGFAVFLPHATGTAGLLAKAKYEYDEDGNLKSTLKRIHEEEFTASDVVKLSYHSDGFVQFSSVTSNRIVSGREDGTIKGLGLVSWPLSNPISTGPSIIVTFWGLKSFPADSNLRPSDYVFNTSEAKDLGTFHNRKLTYAFELFIFKAESFRTTITRNGKEYARVWLMHGTAEKPGPVRRFIEVEILRIRDQEVVIAVVLDKYLSGFKGKTGYMLAGPTDGKYGLTARYPITSSMQPIPRQTLDYRGT